MLKQAWRDTVPLNSEEVNKMRFKYNLVRNLIKLLNEWEDGSFQPTKLRTQIVHFPKKRLVQVPAIRDKIVQHAMCDNYLTARLTKPLTKETCACVENRGTLYASRILKNQLRKYYNEFGRNFYVLKCDIKSYFASIPHWRIYELVNRYVDDEYVKTIVFKFVGMLEVGLALGLQQSQLLANLYLSDLDHKCKELLGAKYYGRYMDDFYIISNDRQYLERCLNYIESYVQSIGLTLNPKTAIFSNKLEFVGFTYFLNETGHVVKMVSKSKKRSKRRHIQKMLRQIDEGKLTIEKFVASYQGYRVHALQGDCTTLIHIWDCVVIEELKKRNYYLKFKGNKVILKCLQPKH
jgi:retron-type reverse transcriptase